MSTVTHFSVGLIQLNWPYGDSVESRRAHVSDRIDTLGDVNLVVLPELWTAGFFRFDSYADVAEPLDGPTVSLAAEHARFRGAYVLTGSFVERGTHGLYNTSVLLSPEGKSLLTYRKVHLFGYQSKEPEVLTPGEDINVVATDLGRIGVSTCYDLRFPEFYRVLADQDVEVMLIPAAWPYARVEHWKLLLRARALENQAFVIGCNVSGDDNGAVYGGASAVVGPDAQVLTEAGHTAEDLETQIDMSRLHAYRHDFPVLRDRVLRPLSSTPVAEVTG